MYMHVNFTPFIYDIWKQNRIAHYINIYIYIYMYLLFATVYVHVDSYNMKENQDYSSSLNELIFFHMILI